MLGTVHNACLGIGVPPKSIVNQQTISNQQSSISNCERQLVSVASVSLAGAIRSSMKVFHSWQCGHCQSSSVLR
jgi:hypothetical protein